MSKYAMIRVSKRTHARLKAFCEKLFDDYAAGIVDLPDSQAEHVSFDYAINRLLNAVIEHRRRARSQRVNRRPGPSEAESCEACIHGSMGSNAS